MTSAHHLAWLLLGGRVVPEHQVICAEHPIVRLHLAPLDLHSLVLVAHEVVLARRVGPDRLPRVLLVALPRNRLALDSAVSLRTRPHDLDHIAGLEGSLAATHGTLLLRQAPLDALGAD